MINTHTSTILFIKFQLNKLAWPHYNIIRVLLDTGIEAEENESSTLNNRANSETQQLLNIVCQAKSDIHDSSQSNESQTMNCINNTAEDTGASMHGSIFYLCKTIDVACGSAWELVLVQEFSASDVNLVVEFTVAACLYYVYLP